MRWGRFFWDMRWTKWHWGKFFLGFEVDKVALGHVFLRVPWFFYASNIRQMVRTHLVTYHRHCINVVRLKHKVCRLRISTHKDVFAELLKE